VVDLDHVWTFQEVKCLMPRCQFADPTRQECILALETWSNGRLVSCALRIPRKVKVHCLAPPLTFIVNLSCNH